METRKFYWGKVTLITGDGETISDVKALIYGDSGLCINQFNPRTQKGKFISVSHINSGKRLTDGFYTHKSARLFCEAVCELLDWNEIGPNGDEIRRWPNIREDVKLMRQLVTDHKTQWRKALVIYKLNGGLDDEMQKT